MATVRTYINCNKNFTCTLYIVHSYKMHHAKKFVSNEKSKVSLYQMLKIQMRQFLLNTALHGYKYIGQNNTTMVTRYSLKVNEFYLYFTLPDHTN